MPKTCYRIKRFSRAHKNIIQRANVILEEFSKLGIQITLRTLYYQFVARAWIPNTHKAYKRLGGVIGDARLAGKIDWLHLEDNVRYLEQLRHYNGNGPQHAMDCIAGEFHIDLWENQSWRPEVWIEKDALGGVVRQVCQENDVPFFCCRGYTSLSEMWRASMRLRGWMDADQKPYIIHFGDHDPSGIDMSRDILQRLNHTFLADCQFERVALNMDQVEEYKPPPNPAKVRDSRYKAYIKKFGNLSWELDALNPLKFRELIEDRLKSIRNETQWKKDLKVKQLVKSQLEEIRDDWQDININKQKLAEATETIGTLQKKLTALEKKSKRRKKK